METAIDGVEVRRNLRAMPRARLVANIERIDNADDILLRMFEDDFDGTKIVLLEDAAELEQPIVDVEELGRATVRTRTSQSVEIAVNATVPCILVLADAYYPGWRATVNDDPTPIYPAYHAFRAVSVPAGESTVRFAYAPASFQIGLIVSVTGCVVLLVAGAWILVRMRT